MIKTLGHSDVVRINAEKGSNAGKGTAYFWLSKDCYDFFPPLTIPNSRGYKPTNSCIINLHYVDLNLINTENRVTFEAGNNVDFRLGTSKFRYTKIAQEGDLMVLSRISEYNYDIRIIKQDSPEYRLLSPYATTFIGNSGKRMGFISNDSLEKILEEKLPTKRQFERLLESN